MSESGCGSCPARRACPVRGSTATIERSCEPALSRPPTTRNEPPSTAPAAWLVAVGSLPSVRTRFVAGSNETTVANAPVPGVPPAIRSRPATAATAV